MGLEFLRGAMSCRVAERLADGRCSVTSESDLAQSQFNGYPARHAVPRSRVEVARRGGEYPLAAEPRNSGRRQGY